MNTSDKQIVKAERQSIYSGPLPLPNHLEQYEKICPGAAERIIKMAEDQSLHRRTLESIVIKSNARNSFFGILSGFFIGIAALDIIGLTAVFVYGSQQNKQERIEKEKIAKQ